MKYHLETNRRTLPDAPKCWQREAPCGCLRIEASGNELHLFPYPHLVFARLIQGKDSETLHLRFSSREVEIAGRNLRALFLALQDFTVKWVRVMPERYQSLDGIEDSVVSSIQVLEAR